MSFHHPKKQFGQNFLTSIPARNAITEAAHLSQKDVVLEIGPGKGFLTKALLDTGAHVVALEKDRDLIPVLKETFPKELTDKQLTLTEGDVLAFIPEDHNLKAGEYKLVANIPYYITGAIFSRFLSDVAQPSHMVTLIQKEVAERIVARDKKESLLSLSIKAYGDPKIVYRVSRGSFFPAPKVDSAVLAIENISRNHFIHRYHEDIFFKLIHAGFAHKRKMCAPYIQEQFPSHNIARIFETLGITTKIRAEDVTLSTWLQLSMTLCTS